MKIDNNSIKISAEDLIREVGGLQAISHEEVAEILTFLKKIALITVSRYLEQ